ncbi:nuclear transport factor 2 family protein [Knoellia sp. S7-12]|uniref:nuclear transport factor 2 family protein n=1 Tax=Knoellia sp. S7-12 TaxID=3126698 RepID=UPI003367181D
MAEFVAAWERMDVDALVRLLTKDVTFTMPPLPAWFDGVDMVRRFLQERVAETPWRLVPVQANGQPGLACYQGPHFGGPGDLTDSDPTTFTLSAVCLLSLRDRKVSRILAFLEPGALSTFDLPLTFGEFPAR